MTTTMNSSSTQAPLQDLYLRTLAVLIGGAAALVLVAVYLGLVSLANSPEHAFELLWDDRYFVAAIATGFGVQAGLYAYIRLFIASSRAARTSNAMAAAGTGSSTLAMLACCAHHLVDVLPVVGLSGAAIFLNDYRIPVMLASLAVNVAGIFVMLRAVRVTRMRVTNGSYLVAGGSA